MRDPRLVCDMTLNCRSRTGRFQVTPPRVDQSGSGAPGATRSLSRLADTSPYRPIGRTLSVMSERLVIPDRAEVERELAVVNPWWQFSVRFNVAVSESIPVARMHERESEGVMMRWGFVPSSAKGDVALGGRAHVRGDALVSSEDVRTAWLYGQRGIVPLAGFYVWQRTQAGHRQPYYVRLVNRLVFGVAVLWERSVTDDDIVVESCALVTVPSNPLLAEIENTTGHMPAILRREDYDTWLRSSVTEATELLSTYPQTRMLSHPVAPHVNHLGIDEPWLIRPVLQDSGY